MRCCEQQQHGQVALSQEARGQQQASQSLQRKAGSALIRHTATCTCLSALRHRAVAGGGLQSALEEQTHRTGEAGQTGTQTAERREAESGRQTGPGTVTDTGTGTGTGPAGAAAQQVPPGAAGSGTDASGDSSSGGSSDSDEGSSSPESSGSAKRQQAAEAEAARLKCAPALSWSPTPSFTCMQPVCSMPEQCRAMVAHFSLQAYQQLVQILPCSAGQPASGSGAACQDA